jgi:hypothetical protein
MPEVLNPASIFLNLDSGSGSEMTAEEYKAFGQALLIIFIHP